MAVFHHRHTKINNYIAKIILFLEIGIVVCYFHIEIGLLVQNTERYLQKLVFLMLSTDL